MRHDNIAYNINIDNNIATISSIEEANTLAKRLKVSYKISENFGNMYIVLTVPPQILTNLINARYQWYKLRDRQTSDTYAGLTFTEFAIMMGYI